MKKRTIDNMEDLLFRAMRLARTAIELIDHKMTKDHLLSIYTEIDLKIDQIEEQEDR